MPAHRLLRPLLLALLVLLPALAQPTPEAPAAPQPFPTLDAGMHTASIKRLAVDRVGRYGVSASDDKTARVWDLHDGRLLQTLRVPVGTGDEGKLYAVAISPDGATVAVGGWTSPGIAGQVSVFFFDRASGRLQGRITGLPNVVHHLAWSPDGQRLAIAMGAGEGIRVHGAAPPFAELGRDADYWGSSYSVDFDAGGRLVSTAWDGKLRLYDRQLKRVGEAQALEGGNRPYFARFSPDGRRIAVGFADSSAVQIVSASDLRPLSRLDTRAADNGSLNSVAWSADGRRVLAAGTNDVNGQSSIRVFDPDSGRQLAVWPVSTNTVMDLQPLADGRVLFASGDPSWGVVDRQGRVGLQQRPPLADHSGNFDGFRISADGARVAFVHKIWRDGAWQRSSRVFDWRSLRLEAAKAPPEMTPPRRDGLAIEDWLNTTRPRLAGQPLPLRPYETSRSLAVAADGRHFALGTEWSVRWFDAAGKPAWPEPTSVPAVAWLVNLSADGRFVVAALADGTLRWYRTQDGSEALALFVHADGERWVAWTPEGFFAAASPEAEQLFGYTLNQGRDREAEFVSSAQLRKAFYRPDLLTARAAGNEAAITAAVAQVGEVRSLLVKAVPPDVDLLSPAEANVEGDYELKLNITPRSGGVGRVRVRLNGVEQPEGREVPVGGPYNQRLRYTPGSYILQVSVYDASGKVESESRTVRLTVRGTPPKPRLHVVAVGVSQAVYDDNKLATPGVEFADQDARAFAAQVVAQAGDGRLYRAVDQKVLTRRSETSRAAIEAALAGVPFEQGDTVVIFLAGHGRALDGKYNFLPADLQLENSDSIRRNALTQERIQAQLRRFANGRVLLVLDTCHAGAMIEDRGLDEAFAIDNLMRESGRAVLAASKSDALAFQDRGRQHGIFTLSLLDGLANADYDKDQVVDVEELTKHLKRDMPIRSKQANPTGPIQTPMRSPTASPFPLVPVAGGRQ